MDYIKEYCEIDFLLQVVAEYVFYDGRKSIQLFEQALELFVKNIRCETVRSLDGFFF